MKKFYQWVFVATLTCGLMTLTSCQGLFDAIFGEDAQPTGSLKPSTEPTKFDAKTTPLTLEALVANTVVTIDLMDGIALSSVDYSTDGKTWTALSSDPLEITLVAVGDKLMLRGANGSYATAEKATRITCSSAAATRGSTRTPATGALCKIYGNTMSLLQKEGFSSMADLTAEYTFRQLFMEADIDIDPEMQLLVASGKLSTGCFEEMFKGNKSLSIAPVLSAEKLVPECYEGMFEDCSRLSAVTMLATSVAEGATVTECVKDWLKNAGTDTASGKAPVLVVSDKSEIDIAELVENAGTDTASGEAPAAAIGPASGEAPAGETGTAQQAEDSGNGETEWGVVNEKGEIVKPSNLPAAEVTIAPKATEGKIAQNSKTPLVTEGAASNGTMMYAVVLYVPFKPQSTDVFSEEVPTAEGRGWGDYYVYYYAKGDDGHNDSEIGKPVKVKVVPGASVSIAPTAKETESKGSGNSLLSVAGTAIGGTLMYKVNYTDAAAPETTDGFSAAVPTAGTDVGQFYVWYYVVGDDNHVDSEIEYAGTGIVTEPAVP